MSIHVGTSGWHYPHWVGPFYPEGLESEDMLGFYAQEFGTVEINNSFYRLPEHATLANWRDSTPSGFVFAFKASRYVTHMKKLHDTDEAVERMVTAARVLGAKLGPLLFQLPPRWHANPERLLAFLASLPDDLSTAFEFRDRSWFDEKIYQALRSHGAAFCIYELDGKRSPNEITADHVYIRLHGPKKAYQGSYSTQDLSGWAGAISSWDSMGKDVYCFFDNDEHGYAARNAGRLRDMLTNGRRAHGS